MRQAEPGPDLRKDGRARPSRWPIPYGYNAAALAGSAILAWGVHCSLPVLIVPLFQISAALELGLGWRRFSRFALCLLLAVTLGSATTWAGVRWNHTHCFVGVPASLTGWRHDNSLSSSIGRLQLPPNYDDWLQDHGATRWVYETRGVTGFPIQGVEVHYGTGDVPMLLPGKGLFSLLANFALFSAAFLALAFAIPQRALRHLTMAALYPASIVSVFGMGYLVQGLIGVF
jgi:hypothetical protein